MRIVSLEVLGHGEFRYHCIEKTRSVWCNSRKIECRRTLHLRRKCCTGEERKKESDSLFKESVSSMSEVRGEWGGSDRNEESGGKKGCA